MVRFGLDGSAYEVAARCKSHGSYVKTEGPKQAVEVTGQAQPPESMSVRPPELEAVSVSEGFQRNPALNCIEKNPGKHVIHSMGCCARSATALSIIPG